MELLWSCCGVAVELLRSCCGVGVPWCGAESLALPGGGVLLHGGRAFPDIVVGKPSVGSWRARVEGCLRRANTVWR
ncbi:hypothetical protein U128_04335 [Anaplasma marginale str. Gypsy Plains]|nr:hypothetical protein U128_04335 [Anaplasma marginale str. Gypsy Plains]